VGVARDGHELDITRPPYDDVVRIGEVNHLKCERLSAVVARISIGDWQNDPPEGTNCLLGTTP
jgi:hypothetical protein